MFLCLFHACVRVSVSLCVCVCVCVRHGHSNCNDPPTLALKRILHLSIISNQRRIRRKFIVERKRNKSFIFLRLRSRTSSYSKRILSFVSRQRIVAMSSPWQFQSQNKTTVRKIQLNYVRARAIEEGEWVIFAFRLLGTVTNNIYFFLFFSFSKIQHERQYDSTKLFLYDI